VSFRPPLGVFFIESASQIHQKNSTNPISFARHNAIGEMGQLTHEYIQPVTTRGWKMALKKPIENTPKSPKFRLLGFWVKF